MRPRMTRNEAARCPPHPRRAAACAVELKHGPIGITRVATMGGAVSSVVNAGSSATAPAATASPQENAEQAEAPRPADASPLPPAAVAPPPPPATDRDALHVAPVSAPAPAREPTTEERVLRHQLNARHRSARMARAHALHATRPFVCGFTLQRAERNGGNYIIHSDLPLSGEPVMYGVPHDIELGLRVSLADDEIEARLVDDGLVVLRGAPRSVDLVVELPGCAPVLYAVALPAARRDVALAVARAYRAACALAPGPAADDVLKHTVVRAVRYDIATRRLVPVAFSSDTDQHYWSDTEDAEYAGC